MTDTDTDDADDPAEPTPSDETVDRGDGPGDRRGESGRPTPDGGTAETEADASAAETGVETDAGDSGRDLVGYVQWAAFAILCLLALVATFRFYFAASEAISVWFSSDFVPVFQAVFNLVVVLGCALGISVLVRRLQ